MSSPTLDLSEFDYELPPERIAQRPARRRDEARLLVYERASGERSHRRVRELPELLRASDLLVLNDTRVLPARLFARRASGGAIELLLLERLAEGPFAWRALARPARRLRAGERAELAEERGVRLLERALDREGVPSAEWRVRFEGEGDRPLGESEGWELLERFGHVPLPPYIARRSDAEDRLRYQTVYARSAGAVAAPTAGLHLTEALLERLAERGVQRASLTLHVGAGTFLPVRPADLRRGRLHAERFELPPETAAAVARCRAGGGRVVAVGTTSARTLETCADERGELRPGRGSTDLFLAPGHRFRAVDALLTNFHLPRSTLLLLVCALAGRERVLELYREALAEGYRFYSYGDAMLVL